MPILNMIAQWSWGGWGGNVGEPTNFQVTTSWADATIKWTDNNLNSIPPTTFAKSELVRKVGSAPSSPSDWTVVVTETVMNTYQTSWYQDTWLTLGTTYYYRVFSYSTDWGISYCNAASVTPTSWRQPWANTLGYYTMNNDITNQSIGVFPDWDINTATFSTTRVHGTNTYSLYCDGNTCAYLPSNSAFAFGTADFTISCWVYSETNFGSYTWFISNYNDSFWGDSKGGYRIADVFGGTNELNFCWNAWYPNTDIWVDGETNVSIYDDWWHNVVLTRENWVIKLYLDGNTTPVYTNNSYTTKWLGKNNRIYFGANASDSSYSKVYLNDVIFENVARSSQDVADYYTLTS